LSKINSLEEEKKELQEQLETLEARCDSLLQEVAELRQTTQRAADLEQSYSEISDQNDKLKEYVDSLVDRDSCKHCDSNYRNNGRTYNEVSYTQKQRKLKLLKSNSERALWFLESFGFKLDKLFLSDCQTGEKVTLQYNNEKRSAYQFLSEEDKDKVRNVVYIMDKFCVSDAAYHEFSMTNNDGLPRSYLIKQCRQDLNKVYSISRTPGEWPGAQLSFKDELNHQLSKQVSFLIILSLYYMLKSLRKLVRPPPQ
jgi:myosin heavy subunit